MKSRGNPHSTVVQRHSAQGRIEAGAQRQGQEAQDTIGALIYECCCCFRFCFCSLTGR